MTSYSVVPILKSAALLTSPLAVRVHRSVHKDAAWLTSPEPSAEVFRNGSKRGFIKRRMTRSIQRCAAWLASYSGAQLLRGAVWLSSYSNDVDKALFSATVPATSTDVESDPTPVKTNLALQQRIRVGMILARSAHSSAVASAEYESFKATFGPERPPSADDLVTLRRLKTSAHGKRRTRRRIRMELYRRVVSFYQQAANHLQKKVDKYESTGLSSGRDYRVLLSAYQQAAGDHQEVLRILETASFSDAPLLLYWPYNPEVFSFTSRFMGRSPCPRARGIAPTQPKSSHGQIESWVDNFVPSAVSELNHYLWYGLFSVFGLDTVFVSDPPPSASTTDNSRAEPPTQPTSGDQPPSQDASDSNSGGNTPPHRSSSDQPSSNDAPDSNGTPPDVPPDTSSPKISLGIDFSVGVYSSPTLVPSPEGFRHILYGYSIRLAQVLLMPCVAPDSTPWNTIVNRWVTIHGSPSSLFYDPVSVDSSMLEVIRTAANVSETVAPDSLNHVGFKALLTISLLHPSVARDTWFSQIDIIQDTLLASCRCGFWNRCDRFHELVQQGQFNALIQDQVDPPFLLADNLDWVLLDDTGSSSTQAGSGSGSANGAARRQSPSLTEQRAVARAKQREDRPATEAAQDPAQGPFEQDLSLQGQSEVAKKQAELDAAIAQQQKHEAAQKQQFDAQAAFNSAHAQETREAQVELAKTQSEVAKKQAELEAAIAQHQKNEASQKQQIHAQAQEIREAQAALAKQRSDWVAELQIQGVEVEEARKKLRDEAAMNFQIQRQEAQRRHDEIAQARYEYQVYVTECEERLAALRREHDARAQQSSDESQRPHQLATGTPVRPAPVASTGVVNPGGAHGLASIASLPPPARSSLNYGPGMVPVQSHDCGPFGASAAQLRTDNAVGPLSPGSNATRGAPLPKPESKELQFHRQYYATLESLLSKEEEWILLFTQRLLYDSILVGSSQPDMKQVCRLLDGALNRAFDLANKVDMPGYAHHTAVWIFVSFCSKAMDVVFSDAMAPSMSARKMNVTYSLCLQTLFYQIQHVLGSPNAQVDAVDAVVDKTFNRMNHSEVDLMIQNWRTYPQDGLTHALAERKSLDLLRQKLGQLFHSQGDLDIAREALAVYEAHRFNTSWEPAMNDINVDLHQWLDDWWIEKRHRLAVAMYREGVDYIRNKQSGKSTANIRDSVVRMVSEWDSTGEKPAEEFSVRIATQYEHLYSADNRLISSLFDQLPNNDVRWQKGQNTVFPKSHDTLMLTGRRHVSANCFQSILEIRQHTQLVIEALIPTRLSDHFSQLRVDHQKQAETIQATQHTIHQLQVKQLQDQLDAANAALKKQSDDEKNMVLQPVKRPVPRVSFNTVDHQMECNSHRGGFDPYGGLGMTPEGTLATHTSYSSKGPDHHTTGRTFQNSCAPILDSFSKEFGLMEEEVGDCTYIPVYSMDIEPYLRNLDSKVEPIFHDLGLSMQQFSALYPIDLQRRVWSIIPPDVQPVRATSFAKFYSLTQLISKTRPEDAREMYSILSTTLYEGVKLLGGVTQQIQISSMEGCGRRFVGRPDKFHMCLGSHSSITCPQAAYSTDEPANPAFKSVHDMVRPEILEAQCHKYTSNKHDPAICKARYGQYGQCLNCRTYLHHEVYPQVYKVLTGLLRDTLVEESVKQRYRVQLAIGLLTVSWALRPPRSLQSVADSTKSLH